MDMQGVFNDVYVSGGRYPSLRITPLNPIQFTPAGNTRRQEANGLVNAVHDPASHSLRASVV